MEKRAVAQRDGVRVLLVEDNELTRQVMPMLLQKADARYAMDVAGDAEEALEMAEARGYHLVLIDINLGAGPTGLDLMQQLRATARYAETPMIACTAYAMPGDKEMFLEAGFDAYLAKPFGAKQLLKALQHALEH
jgi:CheY-like chemotaxis protein